MSTALLSTRGTSNKTQSTQKNASNDSYLKYILHSLQTLSPIPHSRTSPKTSFPGEHSEKPPPSPGQKAKAPVAAKTHQRGKRRAAEAGPVEAAIRELLRGHAKRRRTAPAPGWSSDESESDRSSEWSGGSDSDSTDF
ncbi:ORF3 [Grizzly bear anellovirus 9]|nr:ORF3 [Grizzly bear anellovirus 9]